MPNPDLSWRAEEACFNAWPALRQVRHGDWLLRFAGGVSRRANSVNPLRPDARDPDLDIAFCEAAYRAQGLPTLFRLPSFLDGVHDTRLARAGYTVEGETVTLLASIDTVAAAADPQVEILTQPDDAWLTALVALQGRDQAWAATYARILEALTLPAGFALLREEGRPAAAAYGALHDGLLCYESVVTDPALRGRGLGRRLLTAANAWGATAGAEAICLQVQADNVAGRALYASLGLRRELYRYHYRRQPGG